MNTEETINSIVAIHGVYGSFHTTPDLEHIVASVPPDWTLQIAQSLARRGLRTFENLKQEIKDCYEVRIDVEHVSILINVVPDGFIFALTCDPTRIGEIQDQIAEITDRYQPESGDDQATSLHQAAPSEKTELVPIPSITMPVKVHANRGARYVNEEPIGEGGTAVVYKAFDIRLNREVALKRFKNADSNPEEENDYMAELASASRIRHHHVLSTYDADIDVYGRYLVMGLIDGEDLQNRITRRTFGFVRFRDFALQTLEGLSATHSANLLHLDLKPSNLMISEGSSGRVHTTLIDFGQAQPTDGEHPPRGRGMKGSIHYCSPEYLNEEPLDVRADVYALGCVFYYALTGKHAFDAPDTIGIMANHLQGQVPDLGEVLPHCPPELRDCIMSMIARNPDDRPSSADAVMRNLLMWRQDLDDSSADLVRPA